MNLGKKILISIFSAFLGLALIPVLAGLTFHGSFLEVLPIMIVYFLPGFAVGLSVRHAEVFWNDSSSHPC